MFHDHEWVGLVVAVVGDRCYVPSPFDGGCCCYSLFCSYRTGRHIPIERIVSLVVVVVVVVRARVVAALHHCYLQQQKQQQQHGLMTTTTTTTTPECFDKLDTNEPIHRLQRQSVDSNYTSLVLLAFDVTARWLCFVHLP